MAPKLLVSVHWMERGSIVCEIIDFQSRRSEVLRRKAEKFASVSNHQAARFEWLKRTGAPLADQVRASLDAFRAVGDCHQIEQILSRLDDETPVAPAN
jgi:hypothetical protein